MTVLLSVRHENAHSVSQFQDVNLSASLRDRSLALYETTHSAPRLGWAQPLAEMQRIRTHLRLRYPADVAAGDPAWNAFNSSLRQRRQVDWTTASRMRDASDALTTAIERDAQRRATDAASRLNEGVWIVALFTTGLLGLIWVLRRAEEARERLTAVLDMTPDYVCIADADARLVYLNRAFRRLLGLAADADLSQVTLTHLYAPRSLERLHSEGIPAALRDGSWLGEVAFLDGQGGDLPMSQRLQAHSHSGGTSRHLSAIIRDIGEQKRVEQSLRAEQERFAAIVAVQRTVAQADLDVDRIMTLIAEGAQRLVRADGGAVETLEGDVMIYRVATGISAAHVGLRIPLSNPLLADCLTSGEVQYCEDADVDPRANRAACQAIGCRSTLLAPVCDAQTVLGVLVMQSVRPHAFTDRDKQTLQIFAEMVASTLRRAAEFEMKQALLAERTETLTRLQESQDLFLSSIEAMQEGLLVQDWDGNILMCNKSAARILGVESSDLIAGNVDRSDWRVVYEDGSEFPREDQPIRVALRTGQAQHDAVLGLWRGDLGITWLMMSAAPVFHLGEERPYAAVLTFSDVTERKQIQQEIGRLAAIVESTEDAVFAMTLDGTLVSWNQGAEGLYGYAPGEIIGQHASFLVPSSQAGPISILIQKVVRGDDLAPLEVTRARKDDDLVEVAMTFSPIRNAAGAVIGVGAIGRDVTAWKQTERALRLSEARLNLAQQIAGIGNWEYDVANGAMRWSQEMFQLLEFDPGGGEPTYEEMLLRYYPDDRGLHDRYVQEAIANGVSYEFDIRVLSEDGRTRWLHSIGHCICNEDAQVIQLHGTLMEVTERKIAEQRIQNYAVALESQKLELEKVNAQLASLASTDALTNLSNRRAFQTRLDHELERADRYNSPLSLVILDVDRFKLYNDTFGHPAGDDVLRHVAQILQDSTREFDLVARYGGEEFVVILPHTDSASAAIVAERCRIAIESAVWEKRTVTASFGVATFRPGMDATALIALADAALYESKAAGRNRVTYGNALDTDTALIVRSG